MKRVVEKLKDPSFYAGLAIAIPGVNWTAISPMGSQIWWVSLIATVGGVVATVLRNPGEH